MATAESCAAVTPDGVEFVDKNDARRLFLGLIEHVPYAGCTHADEHLDKIGTRDREKRHFRLAGDRLGEQRLAGSRRTDHEHTLGNLATEALELARVFEKLDNLGNLGLRLLDACHVGEGHADLVLTKQPRFALAEGHRPPASAASLHLAHEIYPHTNQQQDRE